MQKLLSKMRRCCQDFNMIEENDKIAVGVSGGKDSLLLLKLLTAFQKFSKTPFSVVAISVDCTNGEADYTKLKKWCKEECGVKLNIVPSQIFNIIFNERKEKSPCSLCSKLRRGYLNTEAIKLGCNKIALGHHADDLIETFFLSLFYEGRLSTFQPKSYMDRTKITLIRPMLYIEEREIKNATKTFEILKNPCPVDHKTKREDMKNFIAEIAEKNPIAKERIFGAITNSDRVNLFPPKTKPEND